MYKNVRKYKELKKQCNVRYIINGVERRVGDLKDEDLEMIKYMYYRRLKYLTDMEKLVYGAVKAVIEYRSKCTLDDMKYHINRRRADRAVFVAHNLFNVITNVMKCDFSKMTDEGTLVKINNTKK